MKAGRRSRLSLGRGSGSHLKVGNPDPSHGTKMKGDRLVRDDTGGSQEIFIGEVEVRSRGGEREEKRRERESCWCAGFYIPWAYVDWARGGPKGRREMLLSDWPSFGGFRQCPVKEGRRTQNRPHLKVRRHFKVPHVT